MARAFPNARIVGIDINPASLDLARKLAEKHRLNATFVQCDIADNLWEALQSAGVTSDGQKFDLVTSMGVLHCLKNPSAGFAQVGSIIADDGLFLGYMYSSHGRREVLAVRAILDPIVPQGAPFEERAQAIRLLGLSRRHTLLGRLKTLKTRLKFGPPIVPLELLRVYLRRNTLVHVSDTFSCPWEYMYSFAELQRIFDETDWSFVSLAKGGGLPVSPEDHTRDPKVLALLGNIPRDLLYDYFAYYYRAGGFSFFLRPRRPA